MTPTEIRAKITQEIVAAVASGTPPWRCPWGGGGGGGGLPCNFASRRNYSGINPLILTLAALRHEYTSRFWGTASAWLKQRKAKPKPGERPTEVVFYTMAPVKNKKTGQLERDRSGKVKYAPVLRQFVVYNACQLTADDPASLRRYLTTEVRNDEPDYEPAERLIRASGADIRHGGDRAFYRSRPHDYIRVPGKRSFDSMADYYETVLHELAHWTEDTTRLGKHRNQSYAFNELVAEISACYLLAQLEVPHAERMIEKSKSYVSTWLKAMQDDPKFIFDAAGRASKVADYLMALVAERPARTDSGSGKPKSGGKRARSVA